MLTEFAFLGLALVVGAIVLALVLRIRTIWLPPVGIRNLTSAARLIERSTSLLYKYSPDLDTAIQKLINSQYTKLRVAGDYLQTWRLHLTQETMNAQKKDIAPPLLMAVDALTCGDMLQLNSAFARLPVEPERRKRPKADWKDELLSIFKTVSEFVLTGNRSKWGNAAADLDAQIDYLPADVRPPIYLLKGYLERPIKYTEVCLNRAKLEEQSQFLSQTVQMLADEIKKETVNVVNLWSILARYGERYRFPEGYADS